MELCGSKVQLAPPHRNLISSVAKPRNRLYTVRHTIMCRKITCDFESFMGYFLYGCDTQVVRIIML